MASSLTNSSAHKECCAKNNKIDQDCIFSCAGSSFLVQDGSIMFNLPVSQQLDRCKTTGDEHRAM
jgi:hypothetical protein